MCDAYGNKCSDHDWLPTMAREHARKVMDMPEERFVPVIPVDDLIHTDEHPFCNDPKCGCHSCSTWEDVYRQNEYLENPFDDGLLTVSEKYRLFWGRQV